MRRKALHCAVLFLALFCLDAGAQSAPVQPGDEAALTAATQGLCHSRIAMLGESATHGDGHTLAFKVALVERLVDQCGFDSVFFEASHYQFLHLNRQLRLRRPVTPADVSAAVGGLWEFTQEFQPLAPFLLARASAGKVFLGGLDDQLGQFGQDYANVQMVAELTGLLPPQQRQACSVAWHKRIFGVYSDASPYSATDRAQLSDCLSAMQRANASDPAAGKEDKSERAEMLSAAQRWIGRDFSSDAAYTVNRDRSMFQNLEWLLARQPKRHKVIVWSATVHIAKRGSPTWGDRTGTNFGSLVHRRFGRRAFSLAFSALAGSYRQPGGAIRDMPAPPPDSIEAQVLRGPGAEAVYVGPAKLAALGTVPAALFVHSWQTLPWSTFLDGVVVFRREHPPGRAKGE